MPEGTVNAMSMADVPFAVRLPDRVSEEPEVRFSAALVVKGWVMESEPPDWTVRPPEKLVLALTASDAPLAIVNEPAAPTVRVPEVDSAVALVVGPFRFRLFVAGTLTLEFSATA